MSRDASPPGETERVRRIWERMAPRYDRWIAVFERLLFQGGREWVCSQAQGAVLEIGVGTGRNLPFYPGEAQVTGVDISEAMLELARRRAERLGRPIELRQSDAQALDLADESCDTVVSTLCLCSIPDHRRAIAEARRVLRLGGRFILLEHVRSPIFPIRALQWALEPLTVLLQGDHLDRESLQQLLADGFEVERLERSKLGIVERAVARKE